VLREWFTPVRAVSQHEPAGARVALLHVLAAVDRDIGAGHEAGIVRAQVKHERCHFLGLPRRNPLERGRSVLLYAFPSRPTDCDAAFLLALVRHPANSLIK